MNENKTYFTNETLARFVSAQGKSVQKVVCHLWQNNMNPGNPLEIIDNVELHFTDGEKLTIAINDNGDGLDSIPFDYKTTARELEEEFDGKIKLFAINASATKMWEAVIGKTIQTIKLTKQNDYYLADSLILDFGEEKREITLHANDTLVIDYYEDI